LQDNEFEVQPANPKGVNSFSALLSVSAASVGAAISQITAQSAA